MNSARDTRGHGSHTSIIAGNYVNKANYFGYASGIAKGVAPRARLEIYKVSWDEGSYGSDALAAMDQAVADGVEIISISMSSRANEVQLHRDFLAKASFSALEKGVLLSTSAGNNGSLGNEIIRNGYPWVLTVTAGNIDRWYAGTLTLGNGYIYYQQFMKETPSPCMPSATMTFFQTITGIKPAPSVVANALRGPSRFPGILKPDRALHSDYTILSRTSIACPHATGVAALLKRAHPDWSPTAIKSAIMTTADTYYNTHNSIKDNKNNSIASPLAMGADQKKYDCSKSSSDCNYPSFVVLNCHNRTSIGQNFQRIVTYVGEGATTYKANVTLRKGSTVTVSPTTLLFRNKLEKSEGNNNGEVSFGALTWVEENGNHTVNPIVILLILMYPSATMTFFQTITGIKPAPSVVANALRGPSRFPGILKPDVMTPGTERKQRALHSDYTILSRTSIACPHATGVAALLKRAHPDWSPTAIKSAIMTTADTYYNTHNSIKDNKNNSIASPLAMGADQKKYDCSKSSSDCNYPSFVVLNCHNRTSIGQNFQRIVTYVGEGATTYKANVTLRKGSTVTVSPTTLLFRNKLEKSEGNNNGEVSFGALTWVEENGNHTVNPIVILLILMYVIFLFFFKKQKARICDDFLVHQLDVNHE
ncbi:subtilisin-like protease sbt1.9 [Quercus suber]|uniref:Subtilisin-like protease sbt1.9 n=1 Tax=Quercus suber TaxID=58331 RepID=A0AAW0KT60_QUESU